MIAPLIEAFKELHHNFNAILSRILGLEEKAVKLEAENLAKNQEIADLKIRLLKLEKYLAKKPQ